VSLEAEIAHVLTAPLASLLDGTCQVIADSRSDQWNLPPSDRHALRAWGLPKGPLFRPGLQAESAPALVPNVASERERRLIAPGQRLYLLGAYGSDLVINGEDLTLRVGAVVGSGRLLGIRSRPLTVEDIPQALRAYYAGIYHPAVRFLNSSVAAFVEVAWRWRAAVAVLRRYPGPDNKVDDLEAWKDELDAYYAQQEAVRQQVLAGMVRLDSALADPQLDSIWIETITQDY
jgi:hypothetical protein